MTMIDRNDPLKHGLTPPNYDEYGRGPNRDNAPERMQERESEKHEKQEYPSERASGDRRYGERRRTNRGAQS